MKNKSFASYKEAAEEHIRLLNSDTKSLATGDPTPVAQHYFETEWLPELEKLAKEDNFYLMKAIAVCLKLDLPMPKWIKESFLDVFGQVSSLIINKNSWDEVLGTPYPKGKHIKLSRELAHLPSKIYFECKSLKNKHSELAVDEYLFEQIGRKYGFGKTKASELYYLGRMYYLRGQLYESQLFSKLELEIYPNEQAKICHEFASKKIDQIEEIIKSTKKRRSKNKSENKTNHKNAKRKDQKDSIPSISQASHAIPSREVKT